MSKITLKQNELPRATIRMSPEDANRLENTWPKSGEFATRSEFIKAAINAFVGEEIIKPSRPVGRPCRKTEEDC